MISSLHFFALSSCLNFTGKNTRIYISSISTSTILYNPQTGIFLLFINKTAHWAIWLTQRCKGFELNPNLFLEALIPKGPHITGIYVYITFLFPKFLFSQFLIFPHLMYTLKTDMVKNSPSATSKTLISCSFWSICNLYKKKHLLGINTA